MPYTITIPGEPIAKSSEKEWREIPGFSHYLASSDGEIYSTNSKKILKQTETKDGYLKITLWTKGKGVTKKTHQFIALTFIENPENKPQVNHINGNKKDNRVENLEWVTNAENIQHAVKIGLINSEKAKLGYAKKLEKYGAEYLSKVAFRNGMKADRKKANETKFRKYTKQQRIAFAIIASKKSLEKTMKKTMIVDNSSGEIIKMFNSRKEAAMFLGVDSRRVSDAIHSQREINQNYTVMEANK